LDWENLTLLVRRAVVASHVDQVKTKYSKKNLPLDPGLADILLSWHRQTRYSAQKDWVFASPFYLIDAGAFSSGISDLEE